MTDVDSVTIKGAGAEVTFADAMAASAATEADAAADKKATPADKKRLAPRALSLQLEVALSDEELLAKGQEVAAALAEVELLEAQKKASADHYKARIEIAESRAKALARVIRDKKEERDVECIEEFLFATHSVVVRRADTGEMVSERALRSDERQVPLPIKEDAGKGVELAEGYCVSVEDGQLWGPDDGDVDVDGPTVRIPLADLEKVQAMSEKKRAAWARKRLET